jgi:hypothetical protein
MSNYPLGAEHDSNAPFNRKELQGENVGLFEYLENLEMPYEVRSELQKYQKSIISCNMMLTVLQNNISILSNRDVKIELAKAKRKLSEPQIFIEE